MLFTFPARGQVLSFFNPPFSLCADSVTNRAFVVSRGCGVTGFSIEGLGAYVTDTTTLSFSIFAPRQVSNDTVLSYRYIVETTCGILDTTVLLTLHPSYLIESKVDGCTPFSWQEHTYTSNTIVDEGFHTKKGCDSIIRTYLMVHPTYDLTLDSTICDNHPFLLGNQKLNVTGTYSATLSSVYNCDSSVVVNLTVNAHDEYSFSELLCTEDQYVWNNNTYTESGTYVSILSNALGCDSIGTLRLTIFKGKLQATIRATPSLIPPSNPVVTLYDYSLLSNTRQWAIEGDTFTDKILTYPIPDDVDSLPVQLIVYSVEGCSDTTKTVIFVDRSSFFAPNAFTPDQSSNTTWHPVGNMIADMEIWIFNRQGALVAHLEGVDAEWDGKSLAGSPCPQGAYVYHLQYHSTYSPNQLQKQTGTILLIR